MNSLKWKKGLGSGFSFSCQMDPFWSHHTHPRAQLMRAEEGITHPLKGIALILQVGLQSLQLWSRMDKQGFVRIQNH